jgi:hypothetical protein
MKHLFPISAFVALSIVVFTIIGCTDVDTSKIEFSKDVTVHSGDTVLPLIPSDSITTDIERWTRDPKAKWKRTYTTYAPKLVIRNEHFTLNFLEEISVLNFKPDPTKDKWIQVERAYEPKDIPSLGSLHAKIKEAQQVGSSNGG